MRVAVLFGVILGSMVGFAACGSNDDRSAPVLSSTTTTTMVAAATTLASTTVAPTTTWDRRAKPPLIEGEVDWSAVPIIVTYKPKTSEEQAIVDAAKRILAVDFEFSNSAVLPDEKLDRWLTPEFAAVTRRTALETEEGYSVPSTRDRFEITSVVVVSRSRAFLEYCEFSGGSVYATSSGKAPSLVDAEIVTFRYRYDLRRTESGWRLGDATQLSKHSGVDECV